MNLKMSPFLFLGLLLLFSGCSISKSSVGQSLELEDVINLQSGDAHSGTWKTFDIIIDYKYRIDDRLLVVSGEGELGDHYKMIYDRVRYLWVYLFMLDEDNIIIDSIPLPVHMTTTEDNFVFNRQVKFSDEIKGLSFGYYGHAYEFDGHSTFFFP